MGRDDFPNYADMTDEERSELASIFEEKLAALEKTYKASSPIIRRSAWDCAVAEYRIRTENRRADRAARHVMAFPVGFLPEETDGRD